MPIKKGKSCWGDVMGEFKRGQLNSGKSDGPVVKSRQQAKAIAASICDNKEMQKKVTDEVLHSENQVLEMVMSRLDVIMGRVQEMKMVLESAKMTGKEVEIEPWMVDKITLAADYISAAADNATYGDGVEVDSSYSETKMDDKQKEKLKTLGYSEEAIEAVSDELEARYGEKKGLWDNIHAKRKRIKAGSGERMRKPGEKGAPSAADLKASQGDD